MKSMEVAAAGCRRIRIKALFGKLYYASLLVSERGDHSKILSKCESPLRDEKSFLESYLV
jgi:hypothetical protein